MGPPAGHVQYTAVDTELGLKRVRTGHGTGVCVHEQVTDEA